MLQTDAYRGGENFDLRQILLRGRTLTLRQRADSLNTFLQTLAGNEELLCMRSVSTAADREVTIVDPHGGGPRRMLMFGSNNYLGLANHPYVCDRAQQAVAAYGTGVGGPPLLNGYTPLHRELEERLAALKGAEDALIFSSGYGANVGLVTGLANPQDTILYDLYSHASFCDGVKMAGAQAFHFPHNDVARLSRLLERKRTDTIGDVFVGVEGVYSMDGDCAPLGAIVPLCKSRGAILLLDDAHGTGVMGATGRGTAEHCGVEGQVDVTMGTFSKAFAVTGGFVAASKPLINYLRFFARSYMFSASLPPPVVATVLAGLDVLQREPELLVTLRDNIRYASAGLQSLGFSVGSETPILPLRVPEGMNIRKASRLFHQRGIFMNSIEYPAVPISQQRFRISLMATHTRRDIEKLLEAVAGIWWELGGNQHEGEHSRRNAA